MSNATRTDEPTAFNKFLIDLRGGRTSNDLTRALSDLASAVASTGKPGTLTLTVKLKPDKSIEENGMVLIEDTIKVTRPEPDRASTIMYVNTDGGVSRQDPKQYSFDDLKKVPNE